MKKVILLKGLPGSGKTTYAQHLVATKNGAYKRISKRELSGMIDGGIESKGNAKFIDLLYEQMLLQGLKSGKHMICDDYNLKPKTEQKFRKLVGELAKFEVKDFTSVDPELCIERDLKRPNSVGSREIYRLFEKYINPVLKKAAASKRLQQNTDLPKAIICDLDGTLALMGDRNPFDASTCDQDEINQPIRDIVANYYQQGHQILFLTGREERFRKPTETFLVKAFHHQVHYQLLMRADSDQRKDSLIKQELYNAHIADKYYVDFVLDDRNQVVDMWRALGLVCLQVDQGDF